MNACIVFIASVVNEAEQIKQALPLGKAHVVLDPAQMPQTFKQIFEESVKEDF